MVGAVATTVLIILEVKLLGGCFVCPIASALLKSLSASSARTITLCHSTLQAYAQGIHYPSHLLIMMGWYEGKWWLRRVSGENLTCNSEQMESILEHALTVHHFNFYIPDDLQTSSGIVKGASMKGLLYARPVGGSRGALDEFIGTPLILIVACNWKFNSNILKRWRE